MSHFWRMLLGCMVPMLLIFVLPLFGVSEGITLTVFIVLMFACHLLMMRGHESSHPNHKQTYRETTMQTLSIKRFGLAIAVASALSYLGCVFVMMTVPKEVAIRFFNSLMHGVDVTTIMRWDMPMGETILGAVEIFVLGWLFGALIACCYNCCGSKSGSGGKGE